MDFFNNILGSLMHSGSESGKSISPSNSGTTTGKGSSNPLSLSTSDLIRQQEGLSPSSKSKAPKTAKGSDKGRPSEQEMQDVLQRSNMLSQRQKMMDKPSKGAPPLPQLPDSGMDMATIMQQGMMANKPNMSFMKPQQQSEYVPLPTFKFGGQ